MISSNKFRNPRDPKIYKPLTALAFSLTGRTKVVSENASWKKKDLSVIGTPSHPNIICFYAASRSPTESPLLSLYEFSLFMKHKYLIPGAARGEACLLIKGDIDMKQNIA